MREKISKHFYRDEFECKCGCGFDTVDATLLELLENVRNYFGSSVTINSACRCKDHNLAVGGGVNSQHLLGRASDIVVEGVTSVRVYHYIDTNYPDQYGMGIYDTFVHIDSRNRKGRWDKTT